MLNSTCNGITNFLLASWAVQVIFFVRVGDVTRFNKNTWHGCRLQNPDAYLSLSCFAANASYFCKFLFHIQGKVCATRKILLRF